MQPHSDSPGDWVKITIQVGGQIKQCNGRGNIKRNDEFYGKLEMKYYSGIQTEDVPQKLAVQDLFKELAVLQEQTMRLHSEANLREKLKFKKCDLHHMACSEVGYWKKTLMQRQFLTAKHSHPWVIEFTS